jgi:hypothetical protein
MSNTFRVGLVLAGTISAGAYSAGVIDFLLEALEEWEKRRSPHEPDDRRPVPRHRVLLNSVSGASGGAMTAAMLLRALVSEIKPANDPFTLPDPDISDPRKAHLPLANPFSASWVQSIDLVHLLDTRDLEEKRAKVVSLLDSTVLGDIGNNVLAVANSSRQTTPPPYVENPFHAYFTTTNLRGVPYGFQFTSSTGAYSHQMTAYSDHRHFMLTWPAPPTSPGNVDRFPWELPPEVLQATSAAPSGNWDVMMCSSLASGAFPGGLAPVKLERPATVYNQAEWDVAMPLEREFVPATPAPRRTHWTYESPLTAWPPEIRGNSAYVYRYWNVDGGTMNNEPLALVHNRLAQGEFQRRKGDEATSAIIMVDPFPNKSNVDAVYDDAKPDVVTVFMKLFGALIEQTRFKPDELLLARREDVYSRFVIAPCYQERDKDRVEPAITAALLGGFGGFISQKMRLHDFKLGRRNCQRFLQKTFCLLETNPLVDEMAGAKAGTPEWEAFVQEWAVKDDTTGKPLTSSNLRVLPLIPLFGKAAIEVPLPLRPKAKDISLKEIRKALIARYDVLVPRLCDQVPIKILGVLLKAGLSSWWVVGHRKEVINIIMGLIQKEVDKLG